MQEELETLLEESGHLRTLAFLYASKGMSSKALAIWRILGKNYSSRLLKDSSMDDTMDNSVVDTSGKETAAAEASKILEESSDQALVLQHLGWVYGQLYCCVDFENLQGMLRRGAIFC